MKIGTCAVKEFSRELPSGKYLWTLETLTTYKGLSRPLGPSVPGSVSENGGVRECPKVSLGSWGPEKKCPESVPGVSRKVFRPLRGHSRDTFWTDEALSS